MIIKTRFLGQVFSIAVALLMACASGGGAERGPTTSHEHEEGSRAGGASAAPTAASEGEASEGERAAYENARPVFEKYCVKCHTTQGSEAKPMALHHFSMDSYPFGGHHASEIAATIREVLGAAGKPATMPRDDPGAVKGDDLQRILAWADAYDRAHPKTGESAPHEEHEHEHDEHEHEHAH